MGEHGIPQSRTEAILQNMLGEDNVLDPPQSRVEALLTEILENGGSGSGAPGKPGKDGVTPDITMTASVDGTSGTPNVNIKKGGTKENPIFDFIFGGLTNDEQEFVDYSPYAKIQDYYDDMLVKKTGPMLRTDTAVVNPFSFGAAGTANKLFNESLSKKDYASYKYFYWCDVETTEGNYDFSSILTYLKTCYNEERYTALRVFPNTGDPQRSAVYTINGTEYFSTCPFYIVNKMANKTTKYYYDNKYIITDFNDSSIREAYKNLISAFGTWLNSATFEVNGTTVNCKDLVLYIDMGIFGPWGEGEWYTWRATSCTVSDLVDLHSAYLTALPDIPCNLGQIFKPVNLQTSVALKTNAIFANTVGLEVKKLYNNAGHAGFKIDNIGSNHPLYDGYLDALQLIKFSDEAKKWADRGDFFSGEFAMWTPEHSNYHGYTGGEFALKTFKMFKSPFVLIHNMTDTYSNDKHIEIPEQEKKIWLDLCRAVSSVGARFVITPMSYYNSNVIFKITNIGLTAPKFDLYELKVRVRNLDNTDEYIDIPTNIDLTSLVPECEEPLIYSTNGHIVTTSLSSVPYTNYSVSILGIDRLGYSRTLKFSNYDVNKDGSYLICKIVSGEPIFPSPELIPLNTSSLWSALHYTGVKNLLPYSYSDGEQKTTVGMTFTVEDGIVTANGTTGEGQWAVYWIAHDVDFNVHEPLILSIEEQLPKGVELIIDEDHYISTYTVGHNTKYTLPEEATTFSARIVVHPNITFENLVIKPMLRLASDTDNTWQPPTPTNRELNELVNDAADDIADIWKAQGELGAKNLLPYPYSDMQKTVISGGVSFTLDNTDNLGQFIISGTYVGSGFRYASRDIYKYTKNVEWLKAGTYILSNGVDYTQPNAQYVYVTFRLYDRKNDTYYIDANNQQGKTEVEFTISDEQVSAVQNGELELNIRIYVNIPSSVQTDVTFDNIVVKPMIRLADDIDDTWQPYVPTNKTLANTQNALAPIIGEYLPTTANGTVKKYSAAIGATTVTFNASVFMSKYGLTSSDLNLDISAETTSGNVLAYNSVAINSSGVITITFDELTEAATFVCKASKIQ